MNKKIYSIILANNNGLFGGINDGKLIYNVFFNFYLNKEHWEKPYFITNNNVTLENIINIIKQFTINKNIIILLYFTGHSNKYGQLKFHNEYISNNKFINSINNNILHNIELYFLIDSCFSEKFTQFSKDSNTIYNILKIHYIVSSKENEKSKEMVVSFDKELFKYNMIDTTSEKIPIGIFTYYLCHYMKNVDTLNDIFTIVTKKNIWKFIEKQYHQTMVSKVYEL
jgi:hypothetical protein